MSVAIDLADQLIETWLINNRINIYLLDAIAPEALHTMPIIAAKLE